MKSLTEISGNEREKIRLKQAVLDGHILHGYIIEGEPEAAYELAMAFVGGVLCEHREGDCCGVCPSCRQLEAGTSGNLIVYGSEGSVKDAQIETLIAQTFRKSMQGSRMFLLVRNAERMTERAQNRLLKSLEEPPEGVTIILAAENADSLLQTVRSRCQLIRMDRDGFDRLEEDVAFRSRAVELSIKMLEGQAFYRMWDDLEYFREEKERALKFLSLAETFCRDLLIAPYDRDGSLRLMPDAAQQIERYRDRCDPQIVAGAIECAERAVRDLHQNVSAAHALRRMALEMADKYRMEKNGW